VNANREYDPAGIARERVMRIAGIAAVLVAAAGGAAYSAARSVTADAEGPRAVDVAWEADGDETSFTVERALHSRGSYRIGTWEAVATLFGPARRFEDATAEPGRGYVYRVTSIDAAGAESESERAFVETPPTLGLRVRRCEVRDGWAGSVVLRGSMKFLRSAASHEFDPATQPVQLKAGLAAWLTIPAGDPRWVVRRGAYVWAGSLLEGRTEMLTLDFVRDRIEYRSDADYLYPDASGHVAHVVLRIGGEGVEQYLRWRERRGVQLLSTRR
jgi:hypothetical protein